MRRRREYLPEDRGKQPPMPRPPPLSPAAGTVVAPVEDNGWWEVRFEAALLLLCCVRVVSGLTLCVGDCDETFNYWEPLHYLLYGFGQQTWEYAPNFALRSWAYLVPTRQIAEDLVWWLKLAGCAASKPELWRYIRATWGFQSAVAEAMLFVAVRDTWGRRAGAIFLLLTATSAGVFVASTALLPSSTCMILQFVLLAAWLRGYWYCGVLVSALATLGTGWPFVAVLHLPFAFAALWDTAAQGSSTGSGSIPSSSGNSGLRAAVKLVAWAAVAGVAVLAGATAIDSHYYGRWISPNFNIFMYNVLSAAEGRSDELYGTESASFYVKNLAFNLSPAVVSLAAISVPLAIGSTIRSRWVQGALALSTVAVLNMGGVNYASAGLICLAMTLTVAAWEMPLRALGQARTAVVPAAAHPALLALPGLLWLAVMFSKPHKEERFLYPAYPALLAGAAGTLDLLLRLRDVVLRGDDSGRQKDGKGSASGRNGGIISMARRLLRRAFVALPTLLLLASAAAIGISRSTAVVQFYSAPCAVFQRAYSELAAAKNAGAVATGISATTRKKGNAGKGVGSTLPPRPQQRRLCVGEEWYRFPSSFFLPDADAELMYLRSGFSGQLPQPFAPPVPSGTAAAAAGADAAATGEAAAAAGAGKPEEGSPSPVAVAPSALKLFQGGVAAGTSARPAQPFNDLNAEEPLRYGRLEDCDFVVEMVPSDGQGSPRAGVVAATIAAAPPNRWELVTESRFLDAGATPWYLRAAYLPFFSEARVSWASFSLYRRLRSNA